MIKKVILMFVGVALMALPTTAQNYGNPYKPVTNRSGMPQVEATAPASSFQSTSAMNGSGSSYSANPTLNTDGTASYSSPSKGPLRGKKADLDGDGFDDETGEAVSNPWGTGGGEQTIDNHGINDVDNPIGDAVLPLLLMSLAFCALISLRRKRSEA